MREGAGAAVGGGDLTLPFHPRFVVTFKKIDEDEQEGMSYSHLPVVLVPGAISSRLLSGCS